MGDRTFHVAGRHAGIVHVACGHRLLASHGAQIVESMNGGASWAPVCSLPIPALQRVWASSPLVRRALRAGIHHVVEVSERLIVFASSRIYVFNRHAGFFNPTPSLIEGSRPLAVCDSNGTLYYGQYCGNPDRNPVHILRSTDGGSTWSSACVLPDVRHIHGVFHDPVENALWVTTGDENAESRILMSRDGLRTFTVVAAGTQQTRAVQLLFTDEHVYFGSDSPRERNHIYRIRRSDRSITRLVEVDGSVFYGSASSLGLFFSTACEPSRVNSERSATLWHSPDGEHWSAVMSFRKDLLPSKLFQYGQILFPRGQQPEGRIWITPFATTMDQTSLCLEAG